MKKVFLVLALLLMLAPSTANFLEQPWPGGGVWNGRGWYCINYDDPQHPFGYAVAGPFEAKPDCSAY